MSKIAYILVLFADWANGIFAVLLSSWLLNVEISWWHFLIGVAFSHFPDIDAIPELLRRGRVSASKDHPFDHREGLHYPFVLILLGLLAAFTVPYWGHIFMFAIWLHLFNDFYGTGWGIKLLWPVSNRNYKLLGRRINRLRNILEDSGDWEEQPKLERRLRIVVSWSQEELPAYMSKWGIDDWMGPYYLRLNWISGVEYFLFIIAIVLMVGSLL